MLFLFDEKFQEGVGANREQRVEFFLEHFHSCRTRGRVEFAKRKYRPR